MVIPTSAINQYIRIKSGKYENKIANILYIINPYKCFVRIVDDININPSMYGNDVKKTCLISKNFSTLLVRTEEENEMIEYDKIYQIEKSRILAKYSNTHNNNNNIDNNININNNNNNNNNDNQSSNSYNNSNQSSHRYNINNTNNQIELKPSDYSGKYVRLKNGLYKDYIARVTGNCVAYPFKVRILNISGRSTSIMPQHVDLEPKLSKEETEIVKNHKTYMELFNRRRNISSSTSSSSSSSSSPDVFSDFATQPSSPPSFANEFYKREGEGEGDVKYVGKYVRLKSGIYSKCVGRISSEISTGNFIHLSIYLFIYLFICLFIYSSIYLFIYQSIYLFIYLFFYLFVYLFIYIFLSPRTSSYLCLFFSLTLQNISLLSISSGNIWISLTSFYFL